MHALHIGAVVMAWVIALAWITRLAEAVAGFPRLPHIWASEYDTNPEGNPTVTVVVPARNEAGNIAACIRSLLGQDYAHVHVLAVNDRSTDGTGAVLDQLAAGDSAVRLRVLHVTELPPNWLGKTHAMALAARMAIDAQKPDYLLFTDADIQFAPDAVRRSLVAAVRSGADHFITLPTTIAKTAGEAVVLAYLQVIGMWAARTWRVADPKAKRDAIGVGAFNMLRTEVYERMGGFESLRMEVLEDLTLGRLIKRAGFRQRVAVAPGMVSVHWAAGVSGIVRGMTKNFFAVFEYRVPILLFASLATAVLCIGPLVLLAVPGARLPALLAWAAATGLYGVSSRVSRLPMWCAAFLPAGAVVVVYAMIRSTLVTLIRGGVTWRGTFYSLQELRQHHSRRKVGSDALSADPK
jgi:glycosyltransferase involved in cell wall biosynthesis